MCPARHGQAGFTLLEVLVTVVVVSIGLLGLLGLQTVSLVNTRISGIRGTAAVAAQGMAAHILANSAGARTGAYSDISPASASNPGVDCGGTHQCNPEQIAAYDAWTWENMLGDRLPNGQGFVNCNATGPGNDHCLGYRIVVAWNERDRDPASVGNHLCDAPGIDISGRCFVTVMRP